MDVEGAPDAVRQSRWAVEAAGQAALALVNEASGVGQGAASADGIARGSFAGPRACVGGSRHAILTSVAARMRGLYDAMPEASQAMPVVSFTLADVPSLFSSATMRQIFKFALTAGGAGVSRQDLLSLAGMLCMVEAAAGGDGDGDFSATFFNNDAFVTGVA